MMIDTQAEVQQLKDKMWQRSYYVVFRSMIDPSQIPALMLEHYQWIMGLEKQDKVFASGPLFKESDATGVGMTVLRAASWEEAEELAGGDPFIKSGAMAFEIQRWQINEGRVNVSIDFSDQTFTAS